MTSIEWNNQENVSGIQDNGSRRNSPQATDSAGEIEQLREALGQEHDRYLRAIAEFKNYRRRVESEGNRLAEAGKREMILSLLDIVDDLERALACTSEAEQPSADGAQIIFQKLRALLETEGVCPFDSTGEVFTPDLHEAVMAMEREGVMSGTVVEDLRRGYLWKKELLRPAQVSVAV